MLLDLGRNDVGRVATAGSVRVTQQLDIEYYSHVMHLVSHVQGEMQDLTIEWRPQIVGFVWMQGESDAMSSSNANAYGTNFRSFLWTLREDIAVAGMPDIASAHLISAWRREFH